MLKRLAALLAESRLPLKAAWEHRLRADPPNTALAAPDVLVYRMDDTLERLDSVLRRHHSRAWVEACPPGGARLREHCRCGLNPLLSYFETGAAAMKEVLAVVEPDDWATLDEAWYCLASEEICSLCAVCCRNGGPAAALAAAPHHSRS